MIDIVVPELAESISEASVEEWRVKAGDAVTTGQVLLTIETDKVALEVPATKDGTLAEILKQAGEDVGSGEVLGRIDETGASASTESASSPAASASASASSGEKISINVPELAESIAEASLASWEKQLGEPVAVGQVIATIETDKVALEVPAPADGMLESFSVNPGEDVSSGQEIAIFVKGEAPSPGQTAQAKTSTAAAPSSPAARKVMAEGNLNAAQVSGSGKGGRITKQDAVAAASGSSAAKSVEGSTAQSGPRIIGGSRNVRREKMSKLRSRVADRLLQSTQQTAMLTTFNEADMSAVIGMRKRYRDDFEKRHEVKLGFMSFFVKAATSALEMHPIVNAQIDGKDIVYHDYCDVGIAVGSPRGLVVPVLRNAESMSMAEIEMSIADYGARAGSGSLTVEELTGGTFTITNGGVFGSLMSTPIVNPPQSAILGVHATKERPVCIDGQVVARPMNYLALSYDHRIIDGRDAVLFLVAVKNFLEDPSRLLLNT